LLGSLVVADRAGAADEKMREKMVLLPNADAIKSASPPTWLDYINLPTIRAKSSHMRHRVRASLNSASDKRQIKLSACCR